MNEFIYTWSIKNIRCENSWYRSRQEIVSPLFIADTLQNTAWSLKLYLYFQPKVEVLDDFLRLYLIRRKDDVLRDFAFNCDFSIVTANNLALTSVRSKPTVGEFGMNRVAIFRYHEIFDQKKALILPEGTLTLRCRMWKHEGNLDQFGQCFARTRLEIVRILSFDDLVPRVTRKKTIPIHTKKENKLLLFVNVCHEGDGLKISLSPKNIDKTNFGIFKFSAVQRNRTPLSFSISNIPAGMVWKLPFPSTENKASLMNRFKLTCEFVYSTGKETHALEKFRPCSFKFPEFSPNSILSFIPSGKLPDCPSIYKDLWNLYSKQILCDVKLKIQTKSVWVHKIVLCARSPVFLAMFSGEMKENTSNCIEIEDLEDDTLEKFAAFLYSDNFEESEWNAVAELYYAADKYQVERLKSFCRCYFASNIDISNVCDLFMLADRHSDYDLKSKVESYIATHHDCIFGLSTRKQFSGKQTMLAFRAMVNEYEKNKREGICDKKCTLSSYPSIFERFGTFYKCQAFSDIVIQTNNAKFTANKTMLCAGSLTLRKLLANEKSLTYLEMENLEVDTVYRLLLFLHTDSLEDIKWEDAEKLYRAAIAYQVERLKVKCSCFFLENLKASNASGLLQLAHEHQDVRLKSLVEDFISLPGKDIAVFESLSETRLRIWERYGRYVILASVEPVADHGALY